MFGQTFAVTGAVARCRRWERVPGWDTPQVRVHVDQARRHPFALPSTRIARPAHPAPPDRDDLAVAHQHVGPVQALTAAGSTVAPEISTGDAANG